MSAFASGTPVMVIGLQARPELNGCAARVLGPERDGRLPVRIMDKEDQVLCEVRVRLQNLAVREIDVQAQVLEDRELLDMILSSIARWERCGRASGVCKLWRNVVLGNPALYEHCVIVSGGRHKPSASEMQGKLQRLPTSCAYDVHRHVHNGALPIYPGELEVDIARRIRCVPADWKALEAEAAAAAEKEEEEEGEEEEGEEEEGLGCVHNYVKKLVVLGALLEQPIIDPYGRPELTCVDTFAVARSLNLCHDLRSVLLDLSDWQERIFPDGPKLTSPAYRQGGPVDRWFNNPPPSLEHVQLIGIDSDLLDDAFGEKSKRWRGIFDVKKLPNLRGFAPFEFKPKAVAKWPVEQRARLESVDLTMDNAYELNDFIHMLDLLPNLRRVLWVNGGLDNEDLARLVDAISNHGVLESLYMLGDSHSFDDFQPLAKLSKQLLEFAFSCDSCDFDENAANTAISQLLPRTTVHVFSCYSDIDMTLSTLSREFLPRVLESWQPMASGPLHNSTEPTVLASLQDDKAIDGRLRAVARHMPD
jgi:hypothetical protein